MGECWVTIDEVVVFLKEYGFFVTQLSSLWYNRNTEWKLASLWLLDGRRLHWTFNLFAPWENSLDLNSPTQKLKQNYHT